jgi:molybdopterin-guanine dinucleotide biosynthesis protein B
MHQKVSRVIPIISIIGKSNSGKTTLIEKLVPELTGRGYRVATVKHDVHGFDIDHEGKDSWRHRKAGANLTIISSPRQLALIRDMDHDAPLDDIRDRFIDDVDIIIAEGYKGSSMPKVEIFRSDLHDGPLCSGEDNLVAMVSDKPIECGAPRIDPDNIAALADLLEETFLRAKEG